jgi:hypothetical protein
MTRGQARSNQPYLPRLPVVVQAAFIALASLSIFSISGAVTIIDDVHELAANTTHTDVVNSSGTNTMLTCPDVILQKSVGDPPFWYCHKKRF